MSESEISSIIERDAMTTEQYIAKRDDLLARWEKASTQLQKFKTEEMELRNEFVKFACDSNKKTGTENIELSNGYKAKVVKKINYNVKQDEVNAALDKIENIGGEAGKLIVERLIKWKAELSKTEYDLLDPKYKVIIDEVITTSDGTPSLEIITPKSKKVL